MRLSEKLLRQKSERRLRKRMAAIRVNGRAVAIFASAKDISYFWERAISDALKAAKGLRLSYSYAPDYRVR